jgi:hypothetical protein
VTQNGRLVLIRFTAEVRVDVHVKDQTIVFLVGLRERPKARAK